MTWWPLLHDGLHAFAATPFLALLHSIGIAYSLRKAFPQARNEPFLKGLLSHLLVALGGGTVAAFLTARPLPILTSNLVLPIYVSGYLLINHVCAIYCVLNAVSPLWDMAFAGLDGASRAWALCNGLDSFRAHVNYGHLSKDAVVGQFVLGVLSITAGGILFKWFNGIRRWQWPGWDFGVVCVITALYVAYGDSTHGLGSHLRTQLKPLAHVQKAIGMNDVLDHAEVRTLCAALMAAGFLAGQWINLASSMVASQPRIKARPVKPVAGGTKGKRE
ncbi:hypothetical protein DFJ77DRAFT_188047 [Powellomyces hirtus]|nr:hypothetical protein DFJ77DRAFT_188047 [Powellomyces hirtus]